MSDDIDTFIDSVLTRAGRPPIAEGGEVKVHYHPSRREDVLKQFGGRDHCRLVPDPDVAPGDFYVYYPEDDDE